MGMQSFNLVAWLYWNPSRNAFTIPILDRPVAWYGILFVLGFIIGYFLTIPLFTRLLYRTRTLSTLDILDWQPLIKILKSSSLPPDSVSSRLFNQLDIALRDKIRATDLKKPVDPAIKEALLLGLNHLLQDNQFQRVDLEKAFPQTIASANQVSSFLVDRLCWFIVVGTLLGSRLGAVFFYDWSYYYQHPLEIFKVWKGGLASHGGATGVAIAIYLYVLYVRRWIPSLKFLAVLDCLAMPIALGSCFIRLGNFMNQEILGTPTTLAWGVIFGDPADGSSPTPRHPVQLYESAVYLLTFFFLYFLWKKKGDQLRTGVLAGTVLIFIFASRFILEFWKSSQESFLNSSYFQVGQLLSLPFILLGIIFFYYHKQRLLNNG